MLNLVLTILLAMLAAVFARDIVPFFAPARARRRILPSQVSVETRFVNAHIRSRLR